MGRLICSLHRLYVAYVWAILAPLVSSGVEVTAEITIWTCIEVKEKILYRSDRDTIV